MYYPVILSAFMGVYCHKSNGSLIIYFLRIGYLSARFSLGSLALCFFNSVAIIRTPFFSTQPSKHQNLAFSWFLRCTLKKQHPTFPRQALLFHKLMFSASGLHFLK